MADVFLGLFQSVMKKTINSTFMTCSAKLLGFEPEDKDKLTFLYLSGKWFPRFWKVLSDWDENLESSLKWNHSYFGGAYFDLDAYILSTITKSNSMILRMDLNGKKSNFQKQESKHKDVVRVKIFRRIGECIPNSTILLQWPYSCCRKSNIQSMILIQKWSFKINLFVNDFMRFSQAKHRAGLRWGISIKIGRENYNYCWRCSWSRMFTITDPWITHIW